MNSLTLIDHKFRTKSDWNVENQNIILIELKRKTFES